MRILLATPLYPPDIGGAAPYVKELAKRLSSVHNVTVITYGHLPEKIPEVHIVAVDKRRTVPVRLLSYTLALISCMRKADLVYFQNGPSVELPIFVASFFNHTPIVMHIGDRAAHVYAKTHTPRRLLEKLANLRARTVIDDTPGPKPEILPLDPRPDEALTVYENKWKVHFEMLLQTFTHV